MIDHSGTGLATAETIFLGRPSIWGNAWNMKDRRRGMTYSQWHHGHQLAQPDTTLLKSNMTLMADSSADCRVRPCYKASARPTLSETNISARARKPQMLGIPSHELTRTAWNPRPGFRAVFEDDLESSLASVRCFAVGLCIW